MSKSNEQIALKNAIKFFNGNELAATTYLNKYALRDKDGNLLELSPAETIIRVMRVLADAMPEDKTIGAFFDEAGQPTAELNCPPEEWLKRVFKEEYDPSRSDKTYTWFEIFFDACNDFEEVCPQGSVLAAAGDLNKLQSLSNCFVVPAPSDTMAGIMRTSENMAHIFKRRGGTGVDLSTLRPSGAEVNNAARTSTGAIGWSNHFSNTGRDVGQGGRRAATMLTLNIKHPDSEKWATMKKDLTYCTGANISLWITDEFMTAVKKDTDFELRFPIDSNEPTFSKKVRAKELWDTVCTSAWEMAEPGILNRDTITKTLPAHFYEGYEVVSTNPCSEISLSAYDACRLISIRLLNFVDKPFTKEASFNFDKFEKAIRITVAMGEALVRAENLQIQRILDKLMKEQKEADEDKKVEYQLEIDLWNNVLKKGEEGRRIGLGDHGWGDMFSQLCIKYGSKKSIELAKNIKKCYRDCAYDESVELAKMYGSFKVWDWEVEKDCEFFNTFPEDLLEKMKRYGRRNISILTNAPTGTISMLGECSSGIEPTFRHMYTRRRKINNNEPGARVDFVDQSGDKYTDFPVFEKNIERYFNSVGKELPKNIKNDVELNKLLPDYFITSDKLDWKKRIDFQAVLTEYVDHSLSSTINLPAETNVETVKKLYMYAWEKGLKGVTIYRDGCRSGVLVTDTVEKREELKSIERAEAPKRPKKLPCEVHFTKIKGKDYVVMVGLLNGSVYEVFFGEHHNKIPNKHFSGYVERRNKGKYFLCFLDEEALEFREIDIIEYFDNKDYEASTRLISMSLRHGAPLEYVCEQLKKSSKNITEFGSGLSRILKKYIKIEDLQEQYKQKYGDNIEVRMEDGCVKIINLDTGQVDSKCD